MNESVISGVVLVVLAGLMQGSFTVPMKFTRRWAWEHTWLLFSVVGLLIGPIVVALFSVPHIFDAYRASEVGTLLRTALFGVGWGVGVVLVGLGVDLIGIALGFAIILGFNAAFGTLIPLAVLTPQVLGTARGFILITGLAIVVGGAILCARAGGLKEAASTPSSTSPSSRSATGSAYRRGLLICIAAGILGSMLNLALAFGSPIVEAATRAGASQTGAVNAVWPLIVGAGALVNIGYTSMLLFRNAGWRAFGTQDDRANWMGGTLMGVLWMAGLVVYGSGAAALGTLGAVIGWPLFIATLILTGNIWGLVTGEWKGAPAAAFRSNLAGVLVLIVAVIVISWSGSL